MAPWLNQTVMADADGDTHAPLALAGASLIADRAGALYWPGERTLIVADLHLEKGSSFARFRNHLPPHDTMATLGQLARLVDAYRPARVIALGDSVHDRAAWDRLDGTARQQLDRLAGAVEDWVWVAGNHDPEPPRGVPGRAADVLTLGALVLRHEPGGPLTEGQVEVAGHLHPAARVTGKGGSARRPAFATDGRRLVLPAFGAYAGGLCLSAPPFRPLFDRARFTAYVCGRTRVFTVPGSRVAGWR